MEAGSSVRGEVCELGWGTEPAMWQMAGSCQVSTTGRETISK